LHGKITTVSDYSRRQIAAYGVASENKISVVHNGVDHILAIPPDEAIIARQSLQKYGFVVALANTQPHKNIDLLLRAFARPELADLKLVLVGSAGPQDFIDRGFPVGPNCCFAGRVSDGEFRALYGHALALAFPSRTEGFGLPPLEAMISGCPTIVAPNGALPEVCGEAALYADPEDVDEWVHHIRALADSSALREARAMMGRAHAARYTWENAAHTLINVILQ
jgi:glycosyltransferase involved in cell wall biosynthesis